jgi:hypothetical protein
MLAEPRLLRLPLVRAGNKLAVGDDEPAWRDCLASVPECGLTPVRRTLTS